MPGGHEAATFRHEALIFQGLPGFLGDVVPFVQEGWHAGEPVLVILPAQRMEALKTALDASAAAVQFAGMELVGGNPARILPALAEFVRGQEGRPCRAVAETVYSARAAPEVDECLQHEWLVDVAFGGGPPWRLLCTYDAGEVSPELIEEVRRSHSLLHEAGRVRDNRHVHVPDMRRLLAQPSLPPRPPQADRLSFTGSYLRSVRRFVLRHAGAAGLDSTRANDVVLAVNELAANSIRFGDSHGTLWVWRTSDALVCEVEDDGHVTQPLAGRQKPDPIAEHGRGLWMVNQLCDLVQLRSSPAGTTVRVYVRTEAVPSSSRDSATDLA